MLNNNEYWLKVEESVLQSAGEEELQPQEVQEQEPGQEVLKIQEQEQEQLRRWLQASHRR